MKEEHNAISALNEFFPERALMLSGFLRDVNKTSKKPPAWRESQLVKFIGLLTLNADELKRGYEEKRITKVAWATRNLLEISIWVDFCELSDANAKQFRDDSAQDLLGFAKVMQKQCIKDEGKPDLELDRAMRELVKMAEREFGVSGMEDDFTRVSKAAVEVGRSEEFTSANKLLSKYAHLLRLHLILCCRTLSLWKLDSVRCFWGAGWN